MILFRKRFMSMALVVLSGMPFSVMAETENTANTENGLELWANRCSSCHNARDPKEFSDKQWQVIVQHMRLRAGLSETETKAILEYLQTSNAQ